LREIATHEEKNAIGEGRWRTDRSFIIYFIYLFSLISFLSFFSDYLDIIRKENEKPYSEKLKDI